MRNQLTLIWTLGALIVTGAAQAAEPPVTTPPKPKVAAPSTDGRSGSATNANKASATGKVDLNLAKTDEIEALPGVGPTIAQAIIKARPFKNVNELTNVAGIGPAKFAALKSRVVVKPPTAALGKAPRGESASGTSGVAGNPAEKVAGRSTATAPGAQPQRGSSTLPQTKPSAALGQKVNLNTATLEQLESLPGIGPVKAQAIIDARPFSTIEDVMKVSGIKEGVFGEIKDSVTVK